MSAPFKNTGIIIQARMGSTRLPSKIMLPVKGKPIFQYQIDRLKGIDCPLYIATTVKSADIAVVDFAKQNSIPCFRGDEENVLSRYYECAKENKLDLIVRITSDCPLIDPALIKAGIDQYISSENKNLFLSNTINRTYPRGFDFEIFSFHQLENAFLKAVDMPDKEHVTPYIWKNKSGNVQMEQIARAEDVSRYRLTLDTQEDFTLLKTLIEQYHAELLEGDQIIALMKSHPELVLINQHIEQKKN
jgi:spore coat polysaccharide biosynthesis protein SpsF